MKISQQRHITNSWRRSPVSLAAAGLSTAKVENRRTDAVSTNMKKENIFKIFSLNIYEFNMNGICDMACNFILAKLFTE